MTKTIEPPARPPKAQSSNSLPTTATSAQRLPSIRRDVSHGSDEGTKSVSRESSVVDPAEAQSQSSWFGFGGSSEIAQKYIIKDPALQAIGKQLK